MVVNLVMSVAPRSQGLDYFVGRLKKYLRGTCTLSQLTGAVTPSGKKWLMKRQRWLLGNELCSMQHIMTPIDDQILNNAQQIDLAGNAFAGVSWQSVLICILANVPLEV